MLPAKALTTSFNYWGEFWWFQLSHDAAYRIPYDLPHYFPISHWPFGVFLYVSCLSGFLVIPTIKRRGENNQERTTMKTIMILTVITSISLTANFVQTNMLIKSGQNIQESLETSSAMIDACAKINNVYPDNCQIQAVNVTGKPDVSAKIDMLLPPRV